MPKPKEQKRQESSWRQIRAALLDNHRAGSAAQLETRRDDRFSSAPERSHARRLLEERSRLWGAFEGLPAEWREAAWEGQAFLPPELDERLNRLRATDAARHLSASLAPAAASRRPRF